jgi:hypothetical protein
MTISLLGTHADKAGNNIHVFFSNNIPSTPACSLLFRTYRELLENNLGTQRFYWEEFSKCYIIWGEDDDKNVLSGLVFGLIDGWKASCVYTAFSEPTARNRGISKICFPYYLEKSKEIGAIRTMSCVSVNNQDVIKNSNGKLVSYSGPPPTMIIFTTKI